MTKSTRKFKIGEKTVVVSNVPDYVTDEELKIYAMKKMISIGIESVGKAS